MQYALNNYIYMCSIIDQNFHHNFFFVVCVSCENEHKKYFYDQQSLQSGTHGFTAQLASSFVRDGPFVISDFRPMC